LPRERRPLLASASRGIPAPPSRVPALQEEEAKIREEHKWAEEEPDMIAELEAAQKAAAEAGAGAAGAGAGTA